MKRLAVMLGLLLASCATLTVQSSGSPAEDGLTIQTIAVAPLLNRAGEPNAAKAVRALIMKELQAQNEVGLIELAPDVIIDPERLDRTRAQEIATKLKVDALLIGTVFAFGYETGAGHSESPMVRIDLRLVDAGTGSIVWVATATATRRLVFTRDAVPVSQLAGEAVSQLTDELTGSL